MSSRRMFSARITESTRFIKMPASSQNLYFHLGMNADDDGVAEAYPVMRTVGATEDDLKVLVGKGFVTVLNSDLVSYLNDWRENNCIRADRKIDSIYKDLLLQICPNADLKPSKETYYSRQKLICQTNDRQEGDNCQPNDRIGKDRLGKDRLNNNYQLIVDMYNNTCVSFPRLTKLSEKRKKAIKARMKVYSLEDFQRLFEMAEASSFLKGQNNRNWSATFDWLTADGNMAKVLDGNYSDRGSSKPADRQAQVMEEARLNREYYEAKGEHYDVPHCEEAESLWGD